MDIRVKVTGNGKLENAMERVKAAKMELHAAIAQLGEACCDLDIQFKEAADDADADGQDATQCSE